MIIIRYVRRVQNKLCTNVPVHNAAPIQPLLPVACMGTANTFTSKTNITQHLLLRNYSTTDGKSSEGIKINFLINYY
jgi:hypothetical protein